VQVIPSVAVLFQDFLELLAIYKERNKCGDRDVPYCSGVSGRSGIEASGGICRNWAFRKKVTLCLSLESFLAMAPFAVRCISALPWIGQ
jgi:hypothetical protein